MLFVVMNDNGPSSSKFEQSRENTSGWIVGLFIAFGLIAFGAYGLITGKTYMIGRTIIVVVQGSIAKSLSSAYIFLGLSLNIWFQWARIPNWESLAEKLASASLVGFIISLGYAIYLFIVL